MCDSVGQRNGSPRGAKVPQPCGRPGVGVTPDGME